MNASESGARNAAVEMPSSLLGGQISSSFQQRGFISVGDPLPTSILLGCASGHSSYASRLEMIKLATSTGILGSSNTIPPSQPPIVPSLCGGPLPSPLPSLGATNGSGIGANAYPLLSSLAGPLGMTASAVANCVSQPQPSFPSLATQLQAPFLSNGTPNSALELAVPRVQPESTSSSKSGRRRRRKRHGNSSDAPAVAATSGCAAAASGTNGDEDSNQSGWHLVAMPPEKKKQRAVTYFGKLTPEKRHEVLMNNPKVARKATPQFLLDHDDDGTASFVKPLIGSKESRLVMKFTIPSEDEINSMYSRFEVTVAPMMNGVIGSFLDHEFKNPAQAICALSLVIRSYVSGFTVHKRTEYKNKEGKLIISLQCHTKNNRSKTEMENTGREAAGESFSPDRVKSNCKWKASIVSDAKSTRFTEISDFSLHSRECFRQYARFTPIEVTFQQDFPSSTRKSMMDELNQVPVRPGTLFQRTFRANAAENAEIAKALRKEMESYPIDASIYNSVDGYMEINEEMLEILRYLSMLRAKERLEARVTFQRSLAVTEVTSINLMWNAGKSLLSTHSDVIFCDSIWGVSDNVYNALTIVVIDENNDIRLAAISLTKREEKVRWKSFFLWVKSIVPSFNPKCIISDGAAYIYNAFSEVMGFEAVHVTCWWHLRENVKGQDGLDRAYGTRMLSLTYASNRSELERKRQELVADTVLNYGARSRQVKAVERAAANALIKLKVFTGGTVTNSYAESINSRLKQFGLITVFNMFSILQYFHSFVTSHNVRETPPLLLTDQMKEIYCDDVLRTVTKGVLSAQKLFLSTSTCEVVSVADDRVRVKETISFDPENQKELRTKLMEQQQREKGQSSEQESRLQLGQPQKVKLVKDTYWEVNWAGEKPKCRCNGLVYRGMPCPHIVLAARALHKKIPLECFNPRFFVNSTVINADDDGAATAAAAPPPPTQPEDELGGEEDLVLSCDENSRLEFSQPLQPTQAANKSSVLLKLTKLEEVNLYKQLEENANLLVGIRALPEYEAEATNVELMLSRMVTVAEGTYNSILQQANGNVLSPQLKDLHGSVLVVFADCGDASKSIRDDLHIASACLDMRNPSDAVCRFRGKLKASIIRLLLLYQQNIASVKFVIDQFLDEVKKLVRRCRMNASSGDAGLSRVQGHATSRSYLHVPQMVDEHCLSEIEDSRRQAAAVLSECSSTAAATTMEVGDSEEE